MDKKTPLYQCHVDEGAKMVSYAGYSLPIQYKDGVIKEHMAVRTAAGLFDVSHMGELIIKGKDALKNIQMLMTNDFSDMNDGEAKYSPLCNEEGGVIDDLLVYRIKEDSYLLIVNAANKEKDKEWILSKLEGQVEFEDKTDELTLVALQGPKAVEILSKITNEEGIPSRNFTFIENAKIDDIDCFISKTGYTGEDGFEILSSADDGVKLWNGLLEAGKDLGLVPAGLAARDTLRLEAAMPLYGQELDEDISPLEAGLGFAVKMAKDDFIGKAALESKGKPARKRVGFKTISRGIVREGWKLFDGDQEIGVITSGSHCPYLNYACAMGFVQISYAEIGRRLEADNRGRRVEIEIVALPFYKKGQ